MQEERHVGDAQAAVLEQGAGEVAPDVVENGAEGRAVIGQSATQCPAAHRQRARDGVRRQTLAAQLAHDQVPHAFAERSRRVDLARGQDLFQPAPHDRRQGLVGGVHLPCTIGAVQEHGVRPRVEAKRAAKKPPMFRTIVGRRMREAHPERCDRRVGALARQFQRHRQAEFGAGGMQGRGAGVLEDENQRLALPFQLRRDAIADHPAVAGQTLQSGAK